MSEDGRLRVLFLHGLRQTGSLLEARLSGLCERLSKSATCVFPDGPVLLPLEDGQSEPLLCWWASGSSPAEALRFVAVLASSQAPFDVVAGFSQGAALAHLLVASAALPSLRGAVFFCGYDPTATRTAVVLRAAPSRTASQLRAAAAAAALPVVAPLLSLPSLHVYSEADSALPAGASRSLAALYASPVVHTHLAGHCVPQKADDIGAFAAFLSSLLPPPALQPAVLPAPPRRDVLASFPPYAVPPAQDDELLALAAIFGDEFSLERHNPPVVRVAVAWLPPPPRSEHGGDDAPKVPWLFLEARFGPSYLLGGPLPAAFVATRARGQLRPPLAAEADRAAAEAAAQCHQAGGEPAVFAAATAVREWAERRAPHGPPPASAVADDAAAAAGASDGDDEGDAPGGSKWWEEEEVRAEDVAAAAARAARAGDATAAAAEPAAREAGAAAHGRAWRCTIGLVGKPSSGKSTFFNAATRPAAGSEARMAPHPFTTISPQLGLAYFAAPCPCGRLGLAAVCCPAHGSPGLAPDTWRRHPVVVKDVAGLVPGAYCGRGRGNAFLADIVECDALIHVVDAAGATDSEGQPGGGDPLSDVAWVRSELHAWIFANLRAKFGTLRKRAMPRHARADPDAPMAALCALLSGYRATRPMVAAAMARAGLDAGRLTDPVHGIPAWACGDVHNLVACFLRVRFPILLALNKADLPAASGFIDQMRCAMPHEPAEPCSARAEWWLARHAAQLTYAEGAPSARLAPAASGDADLAAQLSAIDAAVFSRWGGIGVARALARAVALRRPVFVFPVVDLATCEAPERACARRHQPSHQPLAESAAASLAGVVLDESDPSNGSVSEADGGGDDSGADDGDDVAASSVSVTQLRGSSVLRECVMLRPGTTLSELFSALCREGLARDEFVRAERLILPPHGGVDGGAAKRAVMHKDDALDDRGACLVIRIATSKRTPWQAGARPPDKPKGGGGQLPAAAAAAKQPKVVPLEGKKEVFRFQRRKNNFSNM